MKTTIGAVALLSASFVTALSPNPALQAAPKATSPALLPSGSLSSCPGPYKGPSVDSYHWEWTKQPVAKPICPVKPVGPHPERQLLAQWWRQSCNTPCKALNGTVAGDVLFLNYNLTLSARPGTAPIDSTYDQAHPNGDPFNFTLGHLPRLEVIPGFDAALYSMCKGERRAIKVTGAGGYGTKGSPPVIPACAELYFNVELVDFKRGNTTFGNGTAPRRFKW